MTDLQKKYDLLFNDYMVLQDEFTDHKKRYAEVIRKFDEKEFLKAYQVELLKLQNHLEKTNKKLIILCEGRDAAGKGGVIRRITRYMNEKHYRVVALGKPSNVQKGQWFFQRYAEHFPRAGEIVLFDRSWYNRAMVEPVFGFCTEKEHKTFMQDVVSFENNLVREGIILIKLYFSVSKEEQAARFERRTNDPLRQWKFSEVDMQAQEFWDEFTLKKYEMLKKTDTPATPWFVIRSDDKFLARQEAMKAILNGVRYRGRSRTIDFEMDKNIFCSGKEEYKRMAADIREFGKLIE
jgi:polyphosphate kinase 2